MRTVAVNPANSAPSSASPGNTSTRVTPSRAVPKRLVRERGLARRRDLVAATTRATGCCAPWSSGRRATLRSPRGDPRGAPWRCTAAATQRRRARHQPRNARVGAAQRARREPRERLRFVSQLRDELVELRRCGYSRRSSRARAHLHRRRGHRTHRITRSPPMAFCACDRAASKRADRGARYALGGRGYGANAGREGLRASHERGVPHEHRSQDRVDRDRDRHLRARAPIRRRDRPTARRSARTRALTDGAADRTRASRACVRAPFGLNFPRTRLRAPRTHPFAPRSV